VPGVDTSSGRRDVTEPETLATLERCFRLLTSGIGGSTGGGIPARRSSMPLTPNGSRSSTSGTLLGRCLRRSVFEVIKHRVTCMDHNLFDVIWPALKKYSNAYASNSSLDEGNIKVRERRFDITDPIPLAPPTPPSPSAPITPLALLYLLPRLPLPAPQATTFTRKILFCCSLVLDSSHLLLLVLRLANKCKIRYGVHNFTILLFNFEAP
jgi:hypothetical protein